MIYHNRSNSLARYSALRLFILFFVIASLGLRILLMAISSTESGLSLAQVLVTLTKGAVYDLIVAICFTIPYAVWLLFGNKVLGSGVGKAMSYLLIFLMSFIAVFSFFAEYTFWSEFESRFNFIAVDYLIYTYEVVANINQSYPLPILIGCVTLAALVITRLHSRAISKSIKSRTALGLRLTMTLSIIFICSLLLWSTSNTWSESSSNRYQNELSKAGIYSFVAAFRSNELNYNQFYPLITEKKSMAIIRQQLKGPKAEFREHWSSIERNISSDRNEERPNVIMVVLESFSADFMGTFGNDKGLTPNLDSIASRSLLFRNMYATGTRTVRGMEALTLAIPPTPGNSIVRRRDNASLTTIGSIFRDKGYQTTFFYGGDGYFDNMNQYFGSNGFDIVDRGRKFTMGDSYKGKRSRIPDGEVNFENAWGISDEDLYRSVIRNSDIMAVKGKPFYHFVMTTSNHRPFTYPAGSIDIPSGTGRDGAVKYTDHAIGKFLDVAKKKAWFPNTIFIFIADHCASSAGKNEIDIAKYRIPAMIYNLRETNPEVITPLCSQVDLYPTLFPKLGWSYVDNTYGMNVLDINYNPRALLGTYQKLALLQRDSLVILSPKKNPETFIYNPITNEQSPKKLPKSAIERAIAYYQSAFYLYKNEGLKLKKQKNQ